MPTDLLTVRNTQIRMIRLRRLGLLTGRQFATPQEAMVQLGQVQIDPISAVAPSAHLVLRSRCPEYRMEQLDELYGTGPAVFEYFTRVAMLISMDLYPYIAPVVGRLRPGQSWQNWAHEWLPANRGAADGVIRDIAARGPLTSRDFPRDPRTHRAPGTYAGTNRVLDALCEVGELMVCGRRRGEKLYDLAERVVPAGIGPFSGSENERIAALWHSAIRAFGACSAGELAGMFGAAGWPPDRKLARADVVQQAQAHGLRLLAVEGMAEPWVCAEADLDALPEPGERVPLEVRLLPPFDNLLWNRGLVRELFGFDYTFEGYTPPAKRRYGYYTMPILRGTQLIGRLDPRLDRKRVSLAVNGTWLEPGVRPSRALARDLADALTNLARFLGATRLDVGRTTPTGLGRDMQRAIG